VPVLITVKIRDTVKAGKAMKNSEVNEEISQGQEDQEIEQTAMQRAKDRASAARWNLDIAVFLFAVVIVIIILSFQGIGLEIVAPIAVFGLAMVWLCGWRQGAQLYERFYNEELAKLKYEQIKTTKETIEDIVQKAIRERWR